jgi:ParB-like chromosome segregation protein Spo0J
VISKAKLSMVDLTVRIWSGNNAMPLSPYEMSKLVKRLVSFNLSEAEIAKRLDVTTQTVRDMLVLVSAPRQVHERVAAGVMSPTLAVEMMREHGPRVVEEVEAAIQRAAAEGKDRFTRKHVTGAKAAAVIKRSAASAFDLIQAISKDPAYSGLAPDLRDRVAEILQKVSSVTGAPKTEPLPAADSLAAIEAAIERMTLPEASAANDELDVTFDAASAVAA